jgi:hypothetical protein
MAEQDKSGTFSERHGLVPDDAPITIREDAPDDFRFQLLQIASRNCNLRPRDIRDIVCRVLQRRPNPGQQTENKYMWQEIDDLVYNCSWYFVYDITEALYNDLVSRSGSGAIYEDLNSRAANDKAAIFETKVNECFRRMGIGWRLMEGRVITRTEGAVDQIVSFSREQLRDSKLPRSEDFLHDAIDALSKRPKADYSGAAVCAMGALECVAREVSGDPKSTLGEIIKRHPDLCPQPLRESIAKAWGYASDNARHGREGVVVARAEAEFVVGFSASLCSYLVQKLTH